jgi:hypothetical protein
VPSAVRLYDDAATDETPLREPVAAVTVNVALNEDASLPTLS